MPGNGLVAEPGLRVVTPGSGVMRMCPVSVCHQVSTKGQRLPPGCHGCAAAATDDLPAPDPGLGIDGLAHAAEEAEAREIAALRILLAPSHEGANSRRRRVADGDAVL